MFAVLPTAIFAGADLANLSPLSDRYNLPATNPTPTSGPAKRHRACHSHISNLCIAGTPPGCPNGQSTGHDPFGVLTQNPHITITGG